VHSFFSRYARKCLSAFICTAAFVAAGCHNPLTSGFGIAWTQMTVEPGPFTTYIVTVDSVTLNGIHVGEITALATPEIVDFTQLNNYAELYASASIPNDTYTSAIITLDYTPVVDGGESVIGVMDANGVPQLANVVGPDGAAMTTVSVTVNFDPLHPLVITGTFASTSAERLAIDFDLAASNYIDRSTSPATVVVRPFLTVGIQPSDNKLVRVRGPLINSSVGATAGSNIGPTIPAPTPAPGDVGTYSVFVRPFLDEVDSLGSLSLFNSAKTIYTINGAAYVGLPGITALQALSAGTTMTIAYTTFTPDINPLTSPPATGGTFFPVYVLGGSTAEDIFTEGLSGYVVARNGNTVTLRNWTFDFNDDEIFINQVQPLVLPPTTTADAKLLVGPNTTVTVDNSTSILKSNAISVGQYVSARGILPNGNTVLDPVMTLDATGDTSEDTGSVRILNSQVFGSLVSSASGSLVMNVQNINNWPASVFDFTGNGASATPTAAAFAVNTGSIALPITSAGVPVAAGDPVWVNGIMSAFGSAPPDFNATAVNSEASVQVVGGYGTTPAPGNSTAPGNLVCGVGSQVCTPASLQVTWPSGTTTPFTGFSQDGFSIDLSNAQLQTAQILIGGETIALTSLSASPQIVPISATAATSTFSPQYTVGNPTTSSIFPTSTVDVSATAINCYALFFSFADEVNRTMNSANPALQLEARGVYNRTTNTFTATTVNLVL
jgi:hypothetical protein